LVLNWFVCKERFGDFVDFIWKFKMSIIIQLQGLPITASSLDIRRFFKDLSIPDGGVHIIGGELGIAFIAFTNDEDARQAMERENEGGLIKDSKVRLMLSSKSEMKKVIDKARNQSLVGVKLKLPVRPPSTNSVPIGMQSTNNGNVLVTGTASTSTNLQLLDSNLKQSMKTDKQLNQSTMNSTQINYSSDNINQEAPDYRRIRSSPTEKINASRLIQSNESARPHVKQLLDQVRNQTDTGLANSTMVRKRLSGFDKSLANEFDPNQQQTLSNQHVRWNNNGALNDIPLNNNDFDNNPMNGISFQTQQTLNNRMTNNGPFLAQNHHPYSTNEPIPVYSPSIQLQPNRYIVELRGLPLNVKTIDFQTFFRPVGIQIDRDQIKLSLNEKAQFYGVAHIFFNNEKDLESALLLNRRTIHDFTIEVLPVVQNGPLLNTPLSPPQPNYAMELDMLNRSAPPNNFNNHHMFNGDNCSSFSRRQTLYPLFMKGIPYGECTFNDISRFFRPIPVADIVIIQERNGRPVGNAYVIFSSREYFNEAMKRNSNFMGKRYIELFETEMHLIDSYREKVENRLNSINNNDDLNQSNFNHTNRKRKRSPQSNDNNSKQEQIFCVQICGLPPNYDNRDLTAYFKELGISASAIHIMLKPDVKEQNAGECFVEFKTAEYRDKALRQNGDRISGNYRLSVKPISYAKVCALVKPQTPKLSRPKRDFDNDRKSTIVATVNSRANVNDICAFFEDFDLQPQQVEQKLDSIGHSGEALWYLHFRNPKEAQRVIRNMNRRHFIDGFIYLKPA